MFLATHTANMFAPPRRVHQLSISLFALLSIRNLSFSSEFQIRFSIFLISFGKAREFRPRYIALFVQVHTYARCHTDSCIFVLYLAL